MADRRGMQIVKSGLVLVLQMRVGGLKVVLMFGRQEK